MAITFPRPMPDDILPGFVIDLIDGTVEATHAQGYAGIVSQMRAARWIGRFSTGEMLPPRRATWEAWRLSLNGGVNLFTAWDIRKPEPLAYPSGHPMTIAGTWDGTATVTAIPTLSTISLSGLPANFQFTAGDRLGLVQSGRHGYFAILESVTASGAGAATVTVAPFVNPATSAIFTTAAQAFIRRPVCKFRMAAGSWSLGGDGYASTASFEGNQVI